MRGPRRAWNGQEAAARTRRARPRRTARLAAAPPAAPRRTPPRPARRPRAPPRRRGGARLRQARPLPRLPHRDRQEPRRQLVQRSRPHARRRGQARPPRRRRRRRRHRRPHPPGQARPPLPPPPRQARPRRPPRHPLRQRRPLHRTRRQRRLSGQRRRRARLSARPGRRPGPPWARRARGSWTRPAWPAGARTPGPTAWRAHAAVRARAPPPLAPADQRTMQTESRPDGTGQAAGAALPGRPRAAGRQVGHSRGLGAERVARGACLTVPSPAPESRRGASGPPMKAVQLANAAWPRHSDWISGAPCRPRDRRGPVRGQARRAGAQVIAAWQILYKDTSACSLAGSTSCIEVHGCSAAARLCSTHVSTARCPFAPF